MAEARADLEWAQTSSILAMIHNVNSKTIKQPSDFLPNRAPRQTGVDFKALKKVFKVKDGPARKASKSVRRPPKCST